VDELSLPELTASVSDKYQSVKNPTKAIIRDLTHLVDLRAIRATRKDDRVFLSVHLEWPTEMTDGEALEIIKKLPKAKSRSFLAGSLT
jgi:divalent metal cation (Fe/Co/Zn/Cd) transporter